MEEREKEIAHLLGKGLLRRHRFMKRLLKQGSAIEPKQNNPSDQNCIEHGEKTER